MTQRSSVKFIDRLIKAFAALCFIASLALSYGLLFGAPPVKPETLPAKSGGVAQAQIPSTPNPKIAQLAQTRMSKTIIVKPVVIEKPVPPPLPGLSTLIKIKGIMDFGDPKTNEALIENVKSSQTKGYKVGESVQDVNAVVKGIDTGVLFEYGGKEVRLGIQSNESAEVAPVAGFEEQGLASTPKK